MASLGRTHHGGVLVVGNLLGRLTDVFGLTGDGHVVRVEGRVDLTVVSDGRPHTARLENAVAPGSIARVDEAVDAAIQPYGVVGRQLRGAAQKLGDRADSPPAQCA
ncbi:MAG: hypothetical protein ACR2IK_12815 [Chloroflexota bacterium]